MVPNPPPPEEVLGLTGNTYFLSMIQPPPLSEQAVHWLRHVFPSVSSLCPPWTCPPPLQIAVEGSKPKIRLSICFHE